MQAIRNVKFNKEDEMEDFNYNGNYVKDAIIGERTAEEAAEKNGIVLTKIREEQIKVPYITTDVFVTKYVYDSKNVGKAFCYEITENHGFGEYGTYLLTSEGDFDDLADLYMKYMNYCSREIEEG